MYDRQLKIPSNIRTPAFILDVAALKKNMGLAARVRHEAGITMLLATKSFAMPAAFPFMRDALDGTTASGAFEARLGAEDFGKDVHTYAPAFSDDEFDEVLNFSHTIYFNSPTQLEKFLPRMRAYEKKWGKKICVGVRVNPGYASATVGGDLYNPCAPNSRFGVTRGQLDALPWQDIDTLHVHALCEAQYEGSVGLIRHVAQHFAPYLQRVKAINFGGGHFINHPTYDVAVLMGALKIFKQQFPHLQVVMEPGGGLVVNTGWLATRVLDVHENGQKIMLLDCSPTCHFMDALNGSFRPRIVGAIDAATAEADDTLRGKFPRHYILGGKTCMTGDVLAPYAFSRPLQVGDVLFLEDMMHYNFVQTTTFNGTPLPDLALWHEDGRYEVVKRFGYDDFKRRLA